MLHLLFELASERYALPAHQVAKVLPLVQFRSLPQALRGVAGLFAYEGKAVPLLDLAALAHGQPSLLRMSTRIILAPYEDAGRTHLIGLLAEKTTETIRRTAEEWESTGIAIETTPYLGPVTRDEQGLIQRVELPHLLPEPVRAILFRQPPEAGA